MNQALLKDWAYQVLVGESEDAVRAADSIGGTSTRCGTGIMAQSVAWCARI